MSILFAFVGLVSVWPTSASGFLGQVTKPDSGVMSVQQNENSLAEDRLAKTIWDKFVTSKTSTCASLRKMTEAYANDRSEWDFTKDVLNPEFPKFMCPGNTKLPDKARMGSVAQGGTKAKYPCGDVDEVTSDQEGINFFNQKLRENRAKLHVIASHATCARALDLLGDPIPVVRNGAVWELVFKNDDETWHENSALDGGLDAPYLDGVKEGTKTILKSRIVKAYDAVRCNGHSPCHKATKAKDLSPMFRFAKGRGGVGNRLLSLNAGIAWVDGPEKDKDNKPISVEGSLRGFWSDFNNGQHAMDDQSVIECKEDRLSILCAERGADRCKKARASCDLISEYTKQDSRAAKSIWSAAIPFGFVVDEHGLAENAHVNLANPLHVTQAGHVTFHFKNCGVPWIGGVSGSVLEFFGMLEKMEAKKSIDSLLVLQWMAYYELKGFHSLGEVYTALHPFLGKLGYDLDIMRDVQPPMTTNGCAAENSNSEATFLASLSVFVEQFEIQKVAHYRRKENSLKGALEVMFPAQQAAASV